VNSVKVPGPLEENVSISDDDRERRSVHDLPEEEDISLSFPLY
jgi:hypothetical protein